MSAKKDFTATPEQLTPALVGPITVSLHKPLLDDLNTYRQINRFLSEFPQGTPSFPRKTLLDKQLGAIKGIALFLSRLAEIEAGRATDCQDALQSVANDQLKRLLKDADRLNFWQAHDWYTGERTADGEWRFFHAEDADGQSCSGASLREALDELKKVQPDLRNTMDDADAWEG